MIALLLISLSIGTGVQSVGGIAMKDFPGDKVSALMALVESEEHSYRERNRAIWALGQLGDTRALPLLQSHFTGQESDERTALSQHEIGKAIRACQGGFNIGAYIWRHGAWGPR